MNRFLLALLVSAIVLPGFSQSLPGRGVPNPKQKNIVLKKPVRPAIKEESNFLQQPKNPSAPVSLWTTETTIGMTRYDLQTNQSTQNRLYLYEDGTIAGVWTRGMSEPNFSDRGTGYNFFDGNDWAPEPTQRIESVKTGWPSYSPLGANGEIVISHTSTAGLSVAKRNTKGTGTWTESVLPGPVGAVDLSWPRSVTSGPDHNNVHVIAATYVTYQGQDQALLYYRSQNGGATWDKQHVILPGMGSADYNTYGGDCYAWAEPKGDTLAFVVGDNWIDLFMMKSTDGGENWTKTVIFQHPYPKFDETTTYVLDTPTVCDGSVNIVLDHDGNAHVFFGLMRVLNDDLTDQQTSYFPGTDGLAWWKEGMPTMTDITFETLDLNNQIVGYTQDINGNDTILEFDGIATYFLSVTSMPNATIDNEGHIYLFMTSVVEGLTSGSQNYRHIYCRKSEDGGTNWGSFIDVTGSIIHNFNECVFPSVAAASDNNLHILFQMDDEPGLAVRGDEDPYGDNTIVYASVPKSDIVGLIEGDKPGFTVSDMYPNPASDYSMVSVTLEKSSDLSLQLFDLSGRNLVNINKGMVGSGTHYFSVDCRTLPSGMYFYSIKAGNRVKTNKLLVQ